jgi:hypothetical protein
MTILFSIIGILISLIWSLIASLLAIIPIALIGAEFLMKVYAGTALLSNWTLWLAILLIYYITFTELGCWVLEWLNDTIIDGYLSLLTYRLITFVGCLSISGAVYIIQSLAEGFLDKI